MRVGIVTQWFDPEPGPAALPGVLARGLLERGHSVQVLTGYPNYPSGRLDSHYRMHRRMDETLDGVAVRRVALYPNHNSSYVRRFANYSSFGASAVVSGLDALRGADALWVNYSPITVAWPMWIAKVTMKIPSVVHVLDLWPDTVLASGVGQAGSAFGMVPLLNAWCNAMYRSATSVAYISPGVGEALRQRGVPRAKLAYVPMWADEEVFRPGSGDLRAELGISADAVVLLYAGALGEAQGLSTLIDACHMVTDPRFICVIAGSGTSEGELRDRARRPVAADCIRFVGRVPQGDMTKLMATGDINYVGLRPHPLSEMTMPSKTQAALASGRPILVAATGDVAQVARESGAGWVADPGDASSIAGSIRSACAVGRDGLRVLGGVAREFYERTFSVQRGVSQIQDLLQQAADEQRGRRTD